MQNLEAPLYVQVTTRCNMACLHCCYDCTSDGEDMDMRTFMKTIDSACALVMGKSYLGGGEPTLHPHLLDMVRYANKAFAHRAAILSMITNGTCDRTLWFKLLRFKSLQIDVSKDIFHDLTQVKPWVREWAEKTRHRWEQDQWYDIEYEGRAIRCKQQIVRACKKTGKSVVFDLIKINGVRVKPDGTVISEVGRSRTTVGRVSERTIRAAYEALG